MAQGLNRVYDEGVRYLLVYSMLDVIY